MRIGIGRTGGFASTRTACVAVAGRVAVRIRHRVCLRPAAGRRWPRARRRRAQSVRRERRSHVQLGRPRADRPAQLPQHARRRHELAEVGRDRRGRGDGLPVDRRPVPRDAPAAVAGGDARRAAAAHRGAPRVDRFWIGRDERTERVQGRKNERRGSREGRANGEGQGTEERTERVQGRKNEREGSGVSCGPRVSATKAGYGPLAGRGAGRRALGRMASVASHAHPIVPSSASRQRLAVGRVGGQAGRRAGGQADRRVGG